MKKLSLLLALLMLFLCGCTPSNTAMQTTPTTSNNSPEQPPHEHVFNVSQILKEPTCTTAGDYLITCSCGVEEKREIAATGKHNYRNNVCTECQKTELSLTAVSSDYDADGDGQKDVYYFSAQSSQHCVSGIYLWAGDYDRSLSTSVEKSSVADISHWYVVADSSQKLVYRVTVPENGVYEMIIHMRLKDGLERGATYTVNEGKPWEQTIQTSHSFKGESYEEVRTSDTHSSYMYGVKVALVAGENTIAVTAPTDSPKTQHYRDFYFV